MFGWAKSGPRSRKQFSFNKCHKAHQIDQRNARNAKMCVCVCVCVCAGGGGGRFIFFLQGSKAVKNGRNRRPNCVIVTLSSREGGALYPPSPLPRARVAVTAEWARSLGTASHRGNACAHRWHGGTGGGGARRVADRFTTRQTERRGPERSGWLRQKRDKRTMGRVFLTQGPRLRPARPRPIRRRTCGWRTNTRSRR